MRRINARNKLHLLIGGLVLAMFGMAWVLGDLNAEPIHYLLCAASATLLVGVFILAGD